MKKTMKRSIFPETSSPIPCKNSSKSNQHAATHFVDIEREVLSSGIATNSGTATGKEENDERSMTEVNSRKGEWVYNKEKYPITDTSRSRLLLVVVTKMHSSWGTDSLKGQMGNPQGGEIQNNLWGMIFSHFSLLNLNYHFSWHCFYSQQIFFNFQRVGIQSFTLLEWGGGTHKSC